MLDRDGYAATLLKKKFHIPVVITSHAVSYTHLGLWSIRVCFHQCSGLDCSGLVRRACAGNFDRPTCFKLGMQPDFRRPGYRPGSRAFLFAATGDFIPVAVAFGRQWLYGAGGLADGSLYAKNWPFRPRFCTCLLYTSSADQSSVKGRHT